LEETSGKLLINILTYGQASDISVSHIQKSIVEAQYFPAGHSFCYRSRTHPLKMSHLQITNKKIKTIT